MIITDEIIKEAIILHEIHAKHQVAMNKSAILSRARHRNRRTIDSTPRLTRRSKMAARNIVRKLVLQKLGYDPREMTIPQKRHLGRLVSNKHVLVNNIAKKLYKEIRQKDFEQYKKSKLDIK